MTNERQFDLQDRLVDYAVRIIRLSEALPDTKAGKHVAGQILRSGISYQGTKMVFCTQLRGSSRRRIPQRFHP